MKEKAESVSTLMKIERWMRTVTGTPFMLVGIRFSLKYACGILY